MKVSLVICFKQSRVLLWVLRWKLRAKELYFPVPANCWWRQREMRWLLGMPASPGAFDAASALARPPHLRHPGLMLQGIKCSQCLDLGTDTAGAHCFLEGSS